MRKDQNVETQQVIQCQGCCRLPQQVRTRLLASAKSQLQPKESPPECIAMTCFAAYVQPRYVGRESELYGLFEDLQCMGKGANEEGRRNFLIAW